MPFFRYLMFQEENFEFAVVIFILSQMNLNRIATLSVRSSLR
jgi:hypothetical protein